MLRSLGKGKMGFDQGQAGSSNVMKAKDGMRQRWLQDIGVHLQLNGTMNNQ